MKVKESDILKRLVSQLCDAIFEDEKPEIGGFDISAGLFGPNLSNWIRKLSKEIAELQENQK